MSKIITRTNTDAQVVQQLQKSLLSFSLGGIKANGHGASVVGADLETLALQVDSVLHALCQTLEYTSTDLAFARAEATQLSLRVDELESILESVLGDVSFDQALDHAIVDLMDGISSSGAADITADGELVFDSRVTFSKEDLKPYLQHAITTWIEERLQR